MHRMTNCFDDNATIKDVCEKLGVNQGSCRGIAGLEGDKTTTLGVHY